MADYERRLQRLEDRAAAADDSGDLLLELCRKRTAELLASKEMQDYTGPEESEEDRAAVRAVIQAAIEAAQGGR